VLCLLHVRVLFLFFPVLLVRPRGWHTQVAFVVGEHSGVCGCDQGRALLCVCAIFQVTLSIDPCRQI